MKTLEELETFLGRKPKQVEKLMFESYVDNELYIFVKDESGSLRVILETLDYQQKQNEKYIEYLKAALENRRFDIIQHNLVKTPTGFLLAFYESMEGQVLHYRYTNPVYNTIIEDKIIV